MKRIAVEPSRGPAAFVLGLLGVAVAVGATTVAFSANRSAADLIWLAPVVACSSAFMGGAGLAVWSYVTAVPSDSQRRALVARGAAAITVVVCFGARGVARLHDSQRAFVSAMAQPGLAPLTKYLETDATSSRAVLVRTELEQRLKAAQRRCPARVVPLANSSSALCRFLDGSTTEVQLPIWVQTTLHVEADAPAPPGALAESVASAARAWPADWATLVGVATEQLAGLGVVDVKSGVATRGRAAVTLDCAVSESGKPATGGGRGLVLKCDGLLRTRSGESFASFESTQDTTDLPVDASRGPWHPGGPFDRPLARLEAATMAAFLSHFGVAPEGHAAIAAAVGRPPLTDNPYGHGLPQ